MELSLWNKRSSMQGQKSSALQIFLTVLKRKGYFVLAKTVKMSVQEYQLKSWSIQNCYKHCDPRRYKGFRMKMDKKIDILWNNYEAGIYSYMIVNESGGGEKRTILSLSSCIAWNWNFQDNSPYLN